MGLKWARMTRSRQWERSQMADARTGWIVNRVKTVLLMVETLVGSRHLGLLAGAAAFAGLLLQPTGAACLPASCRLPARRHLLGAKPGPSPPAVV